MQDIILVNVCGGNRGVKRSEDTDDLSGVLRCVTGCLRGYVMRALLTMIAWFPALLGFAACTKRSKGTVHGKCVIVAYVNVIVCHDKVHRKRGIRVVYPYLWITDRQETMTLYICTQSWCEYIHMHHHLRHNTEY